MRFFLMTLLLKLPFYKAIRNVYVKSAAIRFLPIIPKQNIVLNVLYSNVENSRRNGHERKGVLRRHFEAENRCAATAFFFVF